MTNAHLDLHGQHFHPLRTLKEISGVADGGDNVIFIDAETEGGWLSEAKATIEILQKERVS